MDTFEVFWKLAQIETALGPEVANVTGIVFLTWLRSSLNVRRVCCVLHAVLSPLPWKIFNVSSVFFSQTRHPLLFLGLPLASLYPPQLAPPTQPLPRPPPQYAAVKEDPYVRGANWEVGWEE